MPDITVVYESGVFKPTTPLALPEGQTLQIRILPETPPLTLEQALQPLIRRGAITMPPRNRPTSLPETPLSLSPPSDLESYGISPTSKNLLSESIIEDRGPL
jgi:predicted DNA-binding antitoxin AbrB/MazE fold protein